MAQLLRMQGEGAVFANRITLEGGVPGATWDDNIFLNDMPMMLSSSYAATFPGGASYTLDAGFFSLSGADDNVSWTAQNGSTLVSNSTLPAAYYVGNLSSISYGLHVGNVAHNVAPSLIIGGYDASRYLSEPLVTSPDSLHLESVMLSVSSGDSAYKDASSENVDLLPKGRASSLSTVIEPGLPYMYLPRSTCDAIAEQIPVTYRDVFDLYFWDTEADGYEKIIGWRHSIAFTLTDGASGGSKVDIHVPFALLNLSLTPPLVEEATPYFPCSPLEDDAKVYLGRSFLQAAYLVQNWQSDSLFLAQAPGPSIAAQNLKDLQELDSTLQPPAVQQDWAESWSGVLKPYTRSADSGDMNNRDDSSGLSDGATAGIAVGGVGAGLIGVGVLYCVLRRRKRTVGKEQADEPVLALGHPSEQSQGVRSEMESTPVVEMDATRAARELDGKSLPESRSANVVHELGEGRQQ